MDYSAHYNRLIERARLRVLEGYCERHHVLPKCMGGGNEPGNLVDLTPEEHYVAHQLLVKIYPEVKGLALSAALMARKAVGMRLYGWLARHHSESMKGHKRNVGHKCSAETRAKISAAHTGMKRSPEHRARTGIAGKGRKQTKEHIEKRAAALRGKKLSSERVAAMKERWEDPDYRARLIAAVRATAATPEAKAIKSAAMKARWEGAEYRSRTIEALRAVASTPEGREIRSAASKAGWAIPEARARRCAANKASRTPAVRAQISASLKALWGDKRRESLTERGGLHG